MDAFKSFLSDVVSDSVNGPAPWLECRSCGEKRRCQVWTVAERERTYEGMDYTETKGQCDDCLKAYGPDDDCVVPEEDPRTEGEIRAEREYRDQDRGEL